MFYLLKKFINLWRPKPQLAEDPWGQRPEDNRPKNRGDAEGPPDLDELLGRFLKSNRRKNNGDGDNSNNRGDNSFLDPSELSPKHILIGLGVLLLIWLSSGFYTVREREHGVVLLMGKYHSTSGSGLNWFWPMPIGKVEKVDVQSIQTLRVGEFKTQKGVVSTRDQRIGQMLTKDENIVEIGVAVQYRVNNAQAYLFEAKHPEDLLREVVVGAIREVVGANSVDEVLTDRRGEWPQEARQIITRTVNDYGIGLEVVALEVQDARAPAEVQDAFEDAVRAREDEERLRLQAEAFTNERIPLARGQAAQIVQASEAYAAKTIAKAEGDASRFNSILSAYNLDPKVLRERLYLETLEGVYSASPKVFVDSEGSHLILNMGDTPNSHDISNIISGFDLSAEQKDSADQEVETAPEKPKVLRDVERLRGREAP